jgi:hypothetical protein
VLGLKLDTFLYGTSGASRRVKKSRQKNSAVEVALKVMLRNEHRSGQDDEEDQSSSPFPI